MVGYPAIDLLMNVLHSSQPPDQASYMYATAALSRLASALQVVMAGRNTPLHVNVRQIIVKKKM